MPLLNRTVYFSIFILLSQNNQLLLKLHRSIKSNKANLSLCLILGTQSRKHFVVICNLCSHLLTCTHIPSKVITSTDKEKTLAEFLNCNMPIQCVWYHSHKQLTWQTDLVNTLFISFQECNVSSWFPGINFTIPTSILKYVIKFTSVCKKLQVNIFKSHCLSSKYIGLGVGGITLNETYKITFKNTLSLPTVQLNISILVKVLGWGFVRDTVVDLCTRRHHRCGSIIGIAPPEEKKTTIYSSSHRQVASRHPGTLVINLEEMHGNIPTNFRRGGTFQLCVAPF